MFHYSKEQKFTKRVGITTLVLATMLALGGCATGTDNSAAEEAPISSEEVTEASAEQSSEDALQSSEEVPEASEVQAATEFPTDFFTIPYQDSHKTIFLLDRGQVESVAGVALSGDTEQQVKDALSNSALWQSDERSAEYEPLIVEAFTREGDSTSQVLRALQNNPTARLKVYVGHDSHKSIAHIEIGNEDD